MLCWRTEGTGYGFTRADVLSMELGEVLFYYRAAKKHYESIADAHRNANNAGKQR